MKRFVYLIACYAQYENHSSFYNEISIQGYFVNETEVKKGHRALDRKKEKRPAIERSVVGVCNALAVLCMLLAWLSVFPFLGQTLVGIELEGFW